MKKLLLYFFIVMTGAMNATTIKNRDAGPTAVAITVNDEGCDQANGSITFGTVTGGVAPFQFSIDNGVTFSPTTNYPNLTAGPYNLTVKDANGDVYNTSVTIANLSGPTAITTTIVNANCGSANGSLTIDTVTGGVTPYTVNFNNSAGSGWIPFDGYGGTTPLPSYTGLMAGTYSLEIRGANGCYYSTSVTIIDTPGPTAIATTVSNPSSCTGNDGSITINGITGGTPPYLYSFNAVGVGPYTATTTSTGLQAGDYNVEVKDSNGCIFYTTVTLLPPVAITAVATTITNSTFCGATDGSITITGVTGGLTPYLYSLDGLSFSTTTNYSNLSAGGHSLIVKDANNCLFTTTVIIDSINKITGITKTVVNSNCGASDGSVTINGVIGGVAPYTYNFNYLGFSSNTTYSGLEWLPYYPLIVKDSNGCEFSTYVSVNNLPDTRAVSISYPQAYYSTALTSSQPIMITGTGTYTGGTYSSSSGLFVNTTTGSIIPSNSVPGIYTVTYTIPNRGTGCPPITATTTVNIYTNTFGLTMTGIYSDFNTDGFTNVGDVINYQFTVTNFDSNPLTNITLAHPSLTFTGGPIASLSGGASDSTTFTAVHVITQNDINNGSVIVDVVATGTLNASTVNSAATTTNTLSISDGIKLIAFRDTNGNGIKDSGEINHNGGEFHYELNNDGTIHNVSSSSGMHTIYESNATNSYDVSFTTNNTYYTVSPSSYTNITVANGSGMTSYNFPITAISYTDLRVSIYANGVGPRPGFTYQNQIKIHNISNQTIPAGTLIFTNDNRVTITNVTPTTTITATGFTYNYGNLPPNEYIDLYVTMQVPTIPSIALGDLLTNTVSVAIPAGDIDTSNNTSGLTQEVRGSYDPNDKNESHGPEIVHSTFTSNDYLTYTIQFENTGTANAVTVKVDDVLDTKLDETSIKMIDASHNYTLDRVGNDLTWHFDGIDLPPSVAGTTIGKGYINFQVKPKAGYAVGDIINNTAYIYFDFNPAIVTNTFATEFVTALGVQGFVNSQFSAYPNPTTGIITIALKNSAGSIDNITVTDVLGKTVLSNTVNAANTTVDLSNLTKGFYFVKIQAEGLMKTLKVVKE
ncbi:MAG: T9SS type A sorting domain-containing protein [Bacteroidota bacterium]